MDGLTTLPHITTGALTLPSFCCMNHHSGDGEGGAKQWRIHLLRHLLAPIPPKNKLRHKPCACQKGGTPPPKIWQQVSAASSYRFLVARTEHPSLLSEEIQPLET